MTRWVVGKPVGDSYWTYLAVPRRRGFFISECWDEKHDAHFFESFWAAAWQAARHLAWPIPVDGEEMKRLLVLRPQCKKDRENLE